MAHSINGVRKSDSDSDSENECYLIEKFNNLIEERKEMSKDYVKRLIAQFNNEKNITMGKKRKTKTRVNLRTSSLNASNASSSLRNGEDIHKDKHHSQDIGEDIDHDIDDDQNLIDNNDEDTSEIQKHGYTVNGHNDHKDKVNNCDENYTHNYDHNNEKVNHFDQNQTHDHNKVNDSIDDDKYNELSSTMIIDDTNSESITHSKDKSPVSSPLPPLPSPIAFSPSPGPSKVSPQSAEESQVSDKSSSELSFDDNSDDENYNPRIKKSVCKSKTQKLLNDYKLKVNSFVYLLKMDNELIDESRESASRVCERVSERETELYNSISSSGMKRIVLKIQKKRVKPEVNDSDKEINKLCRIPKLNTKRKHISLDNNNSDKNDKETIKDNQSPLKKKKSHIKKSQLPSSGDDDNDNDSDIFYKKREDDLNITETIKTVDLEVLSDEELNHDLKHVKKEKQNKQTKDKSVKKVRSETITIDDDDSKDDKSNDDKSKDDKSNDKSKDEKTKKKKNRVEKVIEKANKCLRGGDKSKAKSKKPLNSDESSDDEIVTKKKVCKRNMSDDDYSGHESAKDDDDDDDDDSISEEQSSDMDPSYSDSEDDGEKVKNKKKKNNMKNNKSKKGKNTKGKGRRRVVTHGSSSDESSDDGKDSPSKGRRNIKKIISDKKLRDQTKEAATAETDRRKRIEEKQKLYNEIIKTRSLKSSKVSELILEFDKSTKEALVEVNESLVSSLKPHQVEGIQFMYDCTIETVKHLEKSDGSGCILAHSMGLGKTLQVITFLHTLISNEFTKKHIKLALVVCPVNTSRNWASEFNLWLNDNYLYDVNVFEMSDAKSIAVRVDMLKQWKRRGGVLIIGYTLLSNLIEGNRGRKPSKAAREAFETCLVNPGPDIVVCDEGHLLKNEKTSYNRAVNKISTRRRIILTGTPLQNNLIEYHVMVDFVKPNLLGSKKEFINRFVNPITNGQHEDSTSVDVKIMKKRVHILHTLLNGCVHRCDYGVLTPYLQPKFEYVLSVKLTETQINLYKHYLENITDRQRLNLLGDYSVLRLIWNHPYLLFEQHQRKLEKDAEDDDAESLKNFIDDEEITTESESDSDIECLDPNEPGTSKPPKRRMRTRYGKPQSDEEDEVIKNWGGDRASKLPKEENGDNGKSVPYNSWFAPFIAEGDEFKIELSGKFIILFSILEECERMGDKILLFTQSIDTLDLLEELLHRKTDDAMKKKDEEKNADESLNTSTKSVKEISNVWVKNYDYFRIDGTIAADSRKIMIDKFNEETNYRARLFLLSTKAGGLGINLVGANRCIIFDASWNPTHDVQAIFRIFRFGQTKPVYVYRFLAQGTMEEKIYDRQVIKQSLACRVVDEQQIQRHFKASELSELYVFDPDRRSERPTPVLPKDRLLAELLIQHKDYVVNYHEHDSLLENRPDEGLTEEERKSAWTEYENEKDAAYLKEQQEIEMRQKMLQQAQEQQKLQQQYQQYQQQQNANPELYNALYNTMILNQLSQLRSVPTVQQQQRSLPGYDRMTLEDLISYCSSSGMSHEEAIRRAAQILRNGNDTCTKAYQTVLNQLSADPTNGELKLKLNKHAQEVFNITNQSQRFNQMTRVNHQTPAPTVIEPEDVTPQRNANFKPANVLIEEVD